MAVRIGIDIGSSTTKIVAFEGEHMLPPMAVKADSQVASLYGAFGRYLYENNLQLFRCGRCLYHRRGKQICGESGIRPSDL